MGTLTSILSLTSEGEEVIGYCRAGARFQGHQYENSGEMITIALVGSLVLVSFLVTLLKDF